MSRLLAVLKIQYIKTLYRVAFLPPFRAALYTRAIAPRWPFQQSMAQMNALSGLLLSVESTGCYLEVGCAEGWTTIWQYRMMLERGGLREMHVVDTFAGFTPDDKEAELRRGKQRGLYDSLFAINDQRWFDESMRRAGVAVTSHRADAAKFDYTTLPPVAFAYIDVDLYHPVSASLRRVWQCMVPGGRIVVDDCDPLHEKWDGAHQAYMEFCGTYRLSPEIVAGKLGVIRKA